MTPAIDCRLRETVGRNATRVRFDRSPSAGKMRVKVWALNRVGKLGRPGTTTLRTGKLVGWTARLLIACRRPVGGRNAPGAGPTSSP